MPRIRYVGPFAETEIPALRVVVQSGQEFDAPDPIADSLAEQSDNFERVETAAERKAREKAATEPTSTDDTNTEA